MICIDIDASEFLNSHLQHTGYKQLDLHIVFANLQKLKYLPLKNFGSRYQYLIVPEEVGRVHLNYTFNYIVSFGISHDP